MHYRFRKFANDSVEAVMYWLPFKICNRRGVVLCFPKMILFIKCLDLLKHFEQKLFPNIKLWFDL